jgi:hypothetical protein
MPKGILGLKLILNRNKPEGMIKKKRKKSGNIVYFDKIFFCRLSGQVVKVVQRCRD